MLPMVSVRSPYQESPTLDLCEFCLDFRASCSGPQCWRKPRKPPVMAKAVGYGLTRLWSRRERPGAAASASGTLQQIVSPCLRATGFSVHHSPGPTPCPLPWGETLLREDKPWHQRAPRVEPKCKWWGESLLGNRRSHFKRVPVSPLCRNTHAHGSHYNPIMQQPALLASHVTLPAAQPVNVGVAHVMRQPPATTTSARKSKQHQSAPRWVSLAPPLASVGPKCRRADRSGVSRSLWGKIKLVPLPVTFCEWTVCCFIKGQLGVFYSQQTPCSVVGMQDRRLGPCLYRMLCCCDCMRPCSHQNIK